MYDPERITFFAKTDARGKNVPFGIKAKDRTKHVYVIGKTGMGKSTLLENMAIQDIKNGEGFAFIDPHGQTAETLLDYIPEERINDVLYFAPHDMEFPVSFNIMEDVGADKRHLVVSGLMSVFKKIWVDAWSARMEYILSNTLLALLEYPDSTLLGVNRMLSDKAYRKKVVDNISDPSVKSFWVDEFAKYNERYMQEAGDAIKNKIGQFTANPIIRNIVGQPKSSFDIRKIMDEKKILIMNLSKGLIGETNANLLGSMLTTRIYLAAMSRADLSPMEMQQMPNFYFYVDEFQSFANATFANILSEARKYKLNLTIAHQYIEQMEEDVRNAVFGNVGTTIAFRVGPFDAEILETIFSPKFLAVDICNLGFAQVYLTLMIDGIGSSPFSAVTLPPIQHRGSSCKDMIIAESRKQFAQTRAEVEEAIVKWHGVGLTDESHANNDKKTAPIRTNNFNNDRKPAPKSDNSEVKTEVNLQKSKDDDQRKTASQYQKPISNNEKRNDQPLNNLRSSSLPDRDRKEKPHPKVDNNKKLDDLRSVLKSMVVNDKKTDKYTEVKEQTASNNTNEKKPEPMENIIPKNNLKEALELVKKEVASVPVVDTKRVGVVVPEEKVVKPEPSADVKMEVKTTEIETQSNSSNSDLNPKHLERMMRVTTNDKTPFK